MIVPLFYKIPVRVLKRVCYEYFMLQVIFDMRPYDSCINIKPIDKYLRIQLSVYEYKWSLNH